MKRAYNLPQKKEALDKHCKRCKCRECPLIMTDYCQVGDKTARGINNAFQVLMNSLPSIKKKKKRGRKND